MITEVNWHPTSTTTAEFRHDKFTFKRIGKERPFRYQVWVAGTMIDNTIKDDFEILRIIRDRGKSVVSKVW